MASETTQGERRAYTKPELIDYGAVAKLTQGSMDNGCDGPNGMMAQACL
ncbi:MAG: lasso RiPP family leader peptide-containing protein [Actinomycetota bacterium]|nr:lasso RiPP family leader peptide-containing protein [Actinomycetota bacterium]